MDKKRSVRNRVKREIAGLVAFRKKHYWRGFRACLVFVVLPIFVGLIVVAETFINVNL